MLAGGPGRACAEHDGELAVEARSRERSRARMSAANPQRPRYRKVSKAIQKTGYGRISSYNSDKQRSLRSGSRRSHRCRGGECGLASGASARCASGAGPPERRQIRNANVAEVESRGTWAANDDRSGLSVRARWSLVRRSADAFPLQILVCLGTMLEHDADVAQMARAPLS